MKNSQNFNNNAVIVLDDGKEKMFMGAGIAFQIAKNDDIQK